jgi:hypothetical protein
MTFLVYAPEAYPAERQYVLDVIFAQWLGHGYHLVPSPGPRVAIRLAGDLVNREVTLPDVLFSTPMGRVAPGTVRRSRC